MMFEVLIEMTYLAGREVLPDDLRATLASSMRSDLGAASAPRITIASMKITAEAAGRTRIVVLLDTPEPPGLTNPLDALTFVDTALNRALIRSGTFEEFDVASRQLLVRPARQRATNITADSG